ncbi:hypothetical protein [Candidatus Tisiphia endosymbiont of Metellina segmentata]|uniref:hypothetical protein n=1 Tax=Candidatus Tisiphia endosymbiont of Metellina segmentata TaxID=3066274 RepID=UPI00313B5359
MLIIAIGIIALRKITSGELVYDLRRSNGDWNLIKLYIFTLLTINLLPYIDFN